MYFRWAEVVALFHFLATTTLSLSIVEASIDDLQTALTKGQVNAVQLTAKHLIRVARYDRRGPQLNALVVFNEDVFEHAQASDSYRAVNGSIRSALEGIPGTLKDSYMMSGLTVASGSPAFQNLTANKDAFTTHQLREGGAILLGKTNMPAMANGGMQRGLYGRAESPYNLDWLTAAYASGSSNGAGTSTSASFAVFAMGEETVSSGRAPASNNGLVAYTPSRGIISIRGNWPLFPIADVVVPYARSTADLAHVLDVIVHDDVDTACDYWRGQPFVQLPAASSIRPAGSYSDVLRSDALAGKRLGVPKMFIGGDDPEAQPSWFSDEVGELWADARATLEALGATVEEVDFPVITKFEAPGLRNWTTDYPLPGRINNTSLNAPRLANAYSWDDFLMMANDKEVSGLTRLELVDGDMIYPDYPNTLPDRYGNFYSNSSSARLPSITDSIANRNGTSIFALNGTETVLKAAEAWRAEHLEKWMDELGLDAVVWPSVGDVGPADAETNDTAGEMAWRNGVFFSHGNYGIRQFGIPTMNVPMGLMSRKKMPVDLTIAGKAYSDNNLLSYGYAFEQAHQKRPTPPLTPALLTDLIPVETKSVVGTEPPKLIEVTARRIDGDNVLIEGKVDTSACGRLDKFEIFVDGYLVAAKVGRNGVFSVNADILPWEENLRGVPVRMLKVPDQDLSMVIILATASNGRSSARLLWA